MSWKRFAITYLGEPSRTLRHMKRINEIYISEWSHRLDRQLLRHYNDGLLPNHRVVKYTSHRNLFKNHQRARTQKRRTLKWSGVMNTLAYPLTIDFNSYELTGPVRFSGSTSPNSDSVDASCTFHHQKEQVHWGSWDQVLSIEMVISRSQDWCEPPGKRWSGIHGRLVPYCISLFTKHRYLRHFQQRNWYWCTKFQICTLLKYEAKDWYISRDENEFWLWTVWGDLAGRLPATQTLLRIQFSVQNVP